MIKTITRVCVLLFVTSACLVTPAYCTPSHSLSLQWTRSKELLQVVKRSKEIHPESLMLQYTYQLNNAWQSTVSYMLSDTDRQLTPRLYFEQDSSSYSVTMSYQLSSSWWDFGWFLNQAKTSLDLLGAGQIYHDKYRSQEVFVAWNYAVEQHNFQLSPSVSVSYQQSNFDNREDFLLRDDLRLREIQAQGFDGAYLSTNLNIAYVLDQMTAVLWMPSLTLGWSEALWGDVTTSSRIETMSARVVPNHSLQDSNELAGSGFVSASLVMLVTDYFAEISFTEALKDKLGGSTVSLQLGMDF